MSPDDPTSDRKSSRRRVLKSATIAFNCRHATLPCGVRDLSEHGARLQVEGSIGAPDTFELIVELDGLEAQCEVAWRRGRDIGVRFLAPPKFVTKKREQIIIQSSAGPGKTSLRRKPLSGG